MRNWFQTKIPISSYLLLAKYKQVDIIKIQAHTYRQTNILINRNKHQIKHSPYTDRRKGIKIKLKKKIK